MTDRFGADSKGVRRLSRVTDDDIAGASRTAFVDSIFKRVLDSPKFFIRQRFASIRDVSRRVVEGGVILF